MAIHRFDELRVYQEAFAAAMQIFEWSRHWPQEEKYALTDQIRRSSRSVCANIAEAWRKRRYEKHFISKLSDADAEAAETRVWLQFAHGCDYLDASSYNEIRQTYDHLIGGLVNMMRHPEQWCGPAELIREDTTDYTPRLE